MSGQDVDTLDKMPAAGHDGKGARWGGSSSAAKPTSTAGKDTMTEPRRALADDVYGPAGHHPHHDSDAGVGNG